MLPSNWVADLRRLYDFGEAGRADLVVPAEQSNVAKRIDTLVVDPLRNLPLGSFGLWFYVLREAELAGGRMTGVGGRIVAEVFHRATEGSRTSIVRDPSWRPTLGPDADTFRMVKLLLFAFEGRAELLNPLG